MLDRKMVDKMGVGKGRAVLLMALTVGLCTILFGCGQARSDADSDDSPELSRVNCVVAYGKHANSAADVSLVLDEVESAIKTRGSLAYIRIDGEPQKVGDTKKFRIDSKNSALVEKEIEGFMQESQEMLTGDELIARAPEVDTMGALALANRVLSEVEADGVFRNERMVVVCDSGFSTSGLINFAEIGFSANPDEFAAWARAEGLLPDLSAIDEIRWYCFGDVVAPQEKPAPGVISYMKVFYERVLSECGFNGKVNWIDAVPGAVSPGDVLPEVSVVQIPQPSSFSGQKIELRDDDGILFEPDEADFVDSESASQTLAQYAAELVEHPYLVVHVTGYTAHAGGNSRHEEGELERLRAEAVKAMLLEGGAQDYQVVVEEGGEGPYEFNDEESEEETNQRNRFVELRFE